MVSIKWKRFWMFLGLLLLATGVAGLVNNFDTSNGFISYAANLLYVVIGSALISWTVINK